MNTLVLFALDYHYHRHLFRFVVIRQHFSFVTEGSVTEAVNTAVRNLAAWKRVKQHVTL